MFTGVVMIAFQGYHSTGGENEMRETLCSGSTTTNREVLTTAETEV